MKITNHTEAATARETVQTYLDRSEAEGRDFTKAEANDVEAIQAALEDFHATFARSPEGQATQAARKAYDDRLSGAVAGEDPFTTLARKTRRGQRFNGRATLRGSLKAIGAPSGGFKALAPSGSVVVPAGLTNPEPVAIGQPADGLLSVLTTQTLPTPPTFAYLRQTLRENNAAPVAPGEVKPTSRYGIERIEDRLKVIAHLSEPIDKYWLADLPSLERFLIDELGYGLELAVEAQVLTGSGEGENLTGLLNTTGVQQQDFSTDRPETLRKALTKLQNAGATDPVIALNPLDYEAIDLMRDASGAFLATGQNRVPAAPPLGATPLLSWGVQIALSPSLAEGTAVAMDRNAATLYTDGQVSVEWNTASGFDKNELLARSEGRFGLAVERAPQVVAVDFAQAP